MKGPGADQAELGDELDFEDPVDDVTADEIARDSANDADAIDAIKPEVEDDDPDSQVIVVRNFLGDLPRVQKFFAKVRICAPLFRELLILSKESQSNEPGNCGLELWRDIRRDILVRSYAGRPETANFCRGWLKKREAIAQRDPEQQDLICIASILHPDGFRRGWRHAFVARCRHWCDEVKKLLNTLSSSGEPGLDDWKDELTEATGRGTRGEVTRIRPDRQLDWLLDFKEDGEGERNPIKWYLSVENRIPELATIGLYFLCRTNSSANLERRISHLRWVLGTYRFGMKPRTLELLMIMQDDQELTERIHLGREAYAVLQQRAGIIAG